MSPIVNLSKERRNQIDTKLPGVITIQRWLVLTRPEWVDAKAGPQSRLSVALICLHDAARVACEVDYALSQAYTYVAWYRHEHPQAPLESDARFYGKFYADDSALRLYAAAEHVAEFIKALLRIDRAKLKPYKQKYDSCASAVGNYMVAEMPNHDITSIIKRLLDEGSWGETTAYRNLWVHEQPPLVEGPGIAYKRQSRWREGPVSGSYMMGMGGDTWDEPKRTLDNLLEVVLQAALAFGKTLSELSELLFKKLEPLGIERDFDSEKVRVKDL